MLKKLIPGLVLGFVAILLIGLWGDLRHVGRLLGAFDWRLLPLVLLLTLFNYTLRFFKWHYYLGQIGVHSISLLDSARLFVGGFPLSVTPGKAGEALKGLWLRQSSGASLGAGISVVLAERISDGIAVLLLSTLGVIAYPRYWPAFLSVLALLLCLVAASQIRPLALWLLGIGERLPLVKRTAHVLREVYEGAFTLFRPRSTLLAVGLGFISWLGEGVGFYLILTGLGLPASLHTLSIAVFTLSFSTVVGAASALPGGLGAAEASIAGMLAYTAGVDAPTAAAATLLIRLMTLWFGVGLGLVVWAVSPGLFTWKEEKTHGRMAEG